MALTVSDLESEFVAAGVPADLARELFDTFLELKKRFALGDLRPNVVEGGRLSEAAFRVLQWLTTGTYTQLGTTLPRVPTLLTTLENSGHASDSVRLHIPRTLRVVYDLRNKRDAAHLNDGIDPNVQDGTLVVSTTSWVLAEFVRLLCATDPQQAHKVIVSLMIRDVPVVQEFNGFPVVLKDLKTSDHILVLLYWAEAKPIDQATLAAWLPKSARNNLTRTIGGLQKKHLVHVDGSGIHITLPGEKSVVARGLLQPAT